MNKAKYLLISVYTLLLLGFLAHNWYLLPQLGQALQHGNGGWLAAALGGQLLCLASLTAIYQLAFHATGVKQTFSELLPQSLTALFVDSTAPGGGAAGAAILIDNAQQKQQSGARAAAGILLYYIANYGVFSLFLLLALAGLLMRGALTATIASMALILITTIVGLGILLVVSVRYPRMLGWFFAGVRQVLNAVMGIFGRKPLLSTQWVVQQSAEFSAAATAIAQQPRHLPRVLASAALLHLSGILVFGAILLAFQQPISASLLLIGYSMNVLITNVSPTPNGVGVAEIALPTMLTTLGVPPSASVATTLALRAITFWLPLLLGFIAMRHLAAQQLAPPTAPQNLRL